MLIKQGYLDTKGHPYVEIEVSADSNGTNKTTFHALIDTGFTGFVSVSIIAATTLQLKPHTTTRYELANGQLCDPIPLARAFAGLAGDKLVAGVVCISEHSGTIVGVEFLRTCGKSLMLSTEGVIIVDEAEFKATVAQNAKTAAPSSN
jgi:predicted aspartyl protease